MRLTLLLIGLLLTAATVAISAPSLEKWDAVLREARGQTVDWYAWGGSESVNGYIAWAAGEAERRFGIWVRHVKIADTQLAVNKVVSEVQAGVDHGGSVDLIWINGENFRTLKERDLLFGPLLPHLPNSRFLDVTSPLVQFDFGYPTEGYEAPWGSAQFIFIHDTARVAHPPRSVKALAAWMRAHPGKFTYPAPPHFIGTTFLKHVLYALDGGPEPFQAEFTDEAYGDKVRHSWDFLRGLKPYLWRMGETYPETPAQLDTLFANGEVDFAMDFHPAAPSKKIEQGIYPPTTRTFILEGGTIANTHFVAIPANAGALAGAAVLANFLMSPEAQLKKADATVWGDFTVLEMGRLSGEWRRKFAEQPRGVATLAPDQLQPKLPEPPAAWAVRLEKDWKREIFR